MPASTSAHIHGLGSEHDMEYRQPFSDQGTTIPSTTSTPQFSVSTALFAQSTASEPPGSVYETPLLMTTPLSSSYMPIPNIDAADDLDDGDFAESGSNAGSYGSDWDPPLSFDEASQEDESDIENVFGDSTSDVEEGSESDGEDAESDDASTLGPDPSDLTMIHNVTQWLVNNASRDMDCADVITADGLVNRSFLVRLIMFVQAYIEFRDHVEEGRQLLEQLHGGNNVSFRLRARPSIQPFLGIYWAFFVAGVLTFICGAVFSLVLVRYA